MSGGYFITAEQAPISKRKFWALSSEQKAAGMMMIGLPGFKPDAHVLGMIDSGLAGVIIFFRNIKNSAGVKELTEINVEQGLATISWPTFINMYRPGGGPGIQEHCWGPSSKALGATGEPKLAFELAQRWPVQCCELVSI